MSEAADLSPALQKSLELVAKKKEVEAPKPLTLAQKIAEISASVKKIKMTGVNKDAGYKYLKIEDVVDAVRPGMEKHGLMLTPQVRSIENIPDTKGILRDVLVEWTLEDTTNGSKLTWLVPGTGWDFHDKGTYKALTGSRKYAMILIFNLPVGDNPEQAGPADRSDAKAAQKDVVAKKMAEAAGRGSKTAIDALSQLEPEKKVVISRPEEHNGNYIIVSGFIANPPLETFFDDTDSKRFKAKSNGAAYWRVSSEYEKGLVALCQKLGIEVEG